MTTRAPNVNIDLLHGNINNVKYGKGFAKKAKMTERFSKILEGYNALQNIKQDNSKFGVDKGEMVQKQSIKTNENSKFKHLILQLLVEMLAQNSHSLHFRTTVGAAVITLSVHLRIPILRSTITSVILG